jgi:hypothetical protein
MILRLHADVKKHHRKRGKTTTEKGNVRVREILMFD